MGGSQLTKQVFAGSFRVLPSYHALTRVQTINVERLCCIVRNPFPCPDMDVLSFV